MVATLAEPIEAEVLDRHAGWLRLVAGDATGWWNPEAMAGTEDGAEAGGSSAGVSRSAPTGPTEEAVSRDQTPAVAIVVAARERMGGGARTLPFGPFHLVTDVTVEADLEALNTLTGGLVRLYARRYGLPVPPDLAPWGGGEGPAVLDGSSPGIVILFADSADYRSVARNDHLPAQTIGPVALLSVAPEPRNTRRLLAHEVAHLLNRFAFAGAPPTWLDEGLAGDLELVPSLDAGRLLPGPLGRRAVHMVGGGRRYGPLIALDRLLLDSRRGRLETLPALTALDAEAFQSSSRAADHYALSALWVRFLLDDRTPAGSQRYDLFRRHLQNVVDTPTSPLPPALATPEVEYAFQRWLVDLARRTGETPKRPR